MKKLISLTLLISLCSVYSFSQRKVYRAGESTPSVTIRKDSSNNEAKKPTSSSQKQEKACNCKTDLEFDPTTKQALDKNKTGKPLFTGICVTFYPNRKLEMKVTYVEGREDGI